MKRIVTWFLLAFVAVAVTLQIIKTVRPVRETVFSDGNHLVFFHAKLRCPTCQTMERLVDQVLQENFQSEVQRGILDRRVLDYESRENERLVDEFNVATAAVLLFEQRGGKFVRGVNLAESCWKLVGDEPAFRRMIQTQIENFLQGKEPVNEEESEEISLDPDLNLFDDGQKPSHERKQP